MCEEVPAKVDCAIRAADGGSDRGSSRGNPRVAQHNPIPPTNKLASLTHELLDPREEKSIGSEVCLVDWRGKRLDSGVGGWVSSCHGWLLPRDASPRAWVVEYVFFFLYN